MSLLLNLSQKFMGIRVKFYDYYLPDMVMSRDPDCKFQTFLFFA